MGDKVNENPKCGHLGQLNSLFTGERIPLLKSKKKTFGGLLVGYPGGAIPDLDEEVVGEEGGDAKPHRDFMFTPGINLVPETPENLRMTSAQVPKVRLINRTLRSREEETLPELNVVFDPPFPKPISAKKKSEGEPPLVDPCDWRPKMDEQNKNNFELSKEKNLYVFLGEPENSARPIYCPPKFFTTEQSVFEYYETHNIQQLLETLLTSICIETPQDPYAFIKESVKNLIKGRKSIEEFDKINKVFSEREIRAIFRTFDRTHTDLLSYDQYKIAMDVMGLVRYNPQPFGFDKNQISQDVFVCEAKNAIDLMYNSFL